MSLDWVLTPQRLAWAAALILGYAALCWGIACATRRRNAALAHEGALSAGDGPSVLVVFASQTGQAESIARATARTLTQCGFRVSLQSISQLSAVTLDQYPRSLWMLSTTGEGDAPDQALSFVRQLLPAAPGLQAHQAQVLALGDREYQQFCSFGLAVQDWLAAGGAQVQCSCIDNLNASELKLWQQQVAELAAQWGGSAAQALPRDWLQPPVSQQFMLQNRSRLNPGSEGGPLYLLDFLPVSGVMPQWQSGDLVSLAPPAQADKPRDYSIASIVSEQRLQLMVRLSARADGSAGAASGWLCQNLALGDSLALTLREHAAFRLGENAERPLILIGNGSGLAGLLSHIKARVEAGRSDQWLVFGERNPEHDAIFNGQLQQWHKHGQLERLDCAWSRHPVQRRYVQDVLREQGALLQSWVARGAAIYVCGSLKGMGQGVHEALERLLGAETLQHMQLQRRYCRDVY
ncbi:MAG: sulfite reductase subunit alpha [Comamonas sp.]